MIRFLSTIIEREDVGLAQILFHELSHQKIYVKNDAQFNEGFAMAMADHGGYAFGQRLGMLISIVRERTWNPNSSSL